MDRPLQVCILNGTMRPRGNTAELVKPFMQELMAAQAHVMYVTLHDKAIAPCTGCKSCQSAPDDEPGCAIRDDMDNLYRVIRNADVLVFATPIYTWYCTAPMKAMLDRLFALNKYHDDGVHTMLNGKALALVCTCGDDPGEACAPFEEGMRNYARHVNMEYLGMLAHRDDGGLEGFRSDEVLEKVREFAARVLGRDD